MWPYTKQEAEYLAGSRSTGRRPAVVAHGADGPSDAPSSKDGAEANGIEQIPHVLVVEDDEDVRFATAQVLALAGFTVDAAEHGEAALERLAFAWPDIVVSDVRMPGVDGLELLRRLRNLDPTLPVVLVSGRRDGATEARALREGAFGFIEKPVAADVLIHVVRRALEERTAGFCSKQMP